ncbi:MAG: DUF4388 domain-containing protein [Acidimicrobiales bacterium]|nr:DUF4388 domain-containing protein [Acidimicrobiales bacterium]
MALQGTIETFALPDVLRLLSSTKKTGCLRLEGSRGSGCLWIVDGAVVGGEVSAAPLASDPGEVLFELLRFDRGDFIFDADTVTEQPGEPAEIEPLLDAAEKMLEEWKEIEAVVPSLDHWVALVPELASDEVTISADRWKVLVAIGSGIAAGALGEQLGLSELPLSRAVKELVEQGLVVVEEPREPVVAEAPRSASTVFEPPATAAEPFAAVGEEAEVEEEGAFETFNPDALVVESPSAAVPEPSPTVSSEATDEPDALDAAEIARQLANLSPKAAKAVAAAAKATTPEEREAALAEVDDEEDPINRELLIKFLGSVNS